jgi:hypothetical protein
MASPLPVLSPGRPNLRNFYVFWRRPLGAAAISAAGGRPRELHEIAIKMKPRGLRVHTHLNRGD